jgi:sterol desaturase/sphingolipid hydroxylase (fatty acid hydroxylase superfamily)
MQKGVNFGLTLCIWDYIFGIANIPIDGRDIELGFEKDKNYLKGFWGQTFKPFKE